MKFVDPDFFTKAKTYDVTYLTQRNVTRDLFSRISRSSQLPNTPFPNSKRLRRIVSTCASLLLICVLLTGSFGHHGLFHPKKSVFPRKIWQTWKVDALSFEKRDSEKAKSWLVKNPGMRYEVLTDLNDVGYIETYYGANGFNRLDIVGLYRQLNSPGLAIIKADLLRYLVMYAEGGVYTDIDVEALRAVESWIPDRYEEQDVNMVVGVEIDQPEFKQHPILGQKSMSFCQWTFMCKPHLPVMMRLIEQIMDWLNTKAAQQRCHIKDLKLDFDEVIDGTGPSAFTRAILTHMTQKSGHEVTWDYFHRIEESRLVGGVLVLPVEAFAAGQGHSDSGSHEGRRPLVRHWYHASGWPKAHPRFMHPVLGEVEECNWDKACVRKWDEDRAAFEKLSIKEQSERIEEKKAKDKEKEEEEKRKHDEEEEERKKKKEEERERDERRKKQDEERERADRRKEEYEKAREAYEKEREKENREHSNR